RTFKHVCTSAKALATFRKRIGNEQVAICLRPGIEELLKVILRRSREAIHGCLRRRFGQFRLRANRAAADRAVRRALRAGQARWPTPLSGGSAHLTTHERPCMPDGEKPVRKALVVRGLCRHLKGAIMRESTQPGASALLSGVFSGVEVL